jgi:hypothetical protein
MRSKDSINDAGRASFQKEKGGELGIEEREES